MIKVSGTSQKLLQYYHQMNPQGQEMLLAYAEFLSQRYAEPQHGTKPQPSEGDGTYAKGDLPEPQHLPRPEQESVIAALKRLSNSYAMLDKKTLLSESANLVSDHLLRGRPAAEVINDLENLFATRYRQMSQKAS